MSHWNEHFKHDASYTTGPLKKQSHRHSSWKSANYSQVCLPNGGSRNNSCVGVDRDHRKSWTDNGSFQLGSIRNALKGLKKSQVCGSASDSNKENFPLTSYHFAVDRNAKIYTKNSLVDFSVDWRDVEAVVIFHDDVLESLRCPLCLDSVRAPRMTKCGHLFCLLCILRFFSFHDMAACKCPLCGKTIRLEDLRQVDIRLVAPFYVGMEQSVRLVIRRKDSFIAKPFYRDSWQSYLSECTIPQDMKEDAHGSHMQPIYSRIFFANDERLLYLLERDERDIEQMVKEDSCYIPYADYIMEELIQRKRHLECNIRQQRREKFFEISSGSVVETESAMTGSQSADLDPGQLFDFRFLFQAEGGQDVYLHPLNIKCLLSYYEHLYYAPQVVRGQVLELERCTMTEELKQRYRFLSHLPLGCEFYFVELDLSAILPLHVLNKFARTLQKRAQERLEREKEELAFHQERDLTPAYEEERKNWCRTQVSVDMSEQSFPSLVGLSNDSNQQSEEESNTEEEPSSSYAAVTSHMGYFPSIRGKFGSPNGRWMHCSWKKNSPDNSNSQASESPCMKNKKNKKVVWSNVPRRKVFD
jgi:hypothetical protein